MTDEVETKKGRPPVARVQPSQAASSKRRSGGNFFTKHQTIINFWLDFILLLGFMALIWVSVIVRFVFPPAGSAAGYSLWGLGLREWMDVQFGILGAFFFGIVLHLMLHWTWVCGVIGGRLLRHRDGSKRVMDDGQRTILGVGLMIVLLNIMGIGIAIAKLAVQSPL
ncbi:DUF4405 domain-containing protein [Planctomycetota bacterium]